MKCLVLSRNRHSEPQLSVLFYSFLVSLFVFLFVCLFVCLFVLSNEYVYVLVCFKPFVVE